jgi:hypothetical protein
MTVPTGAMPEMPELDYYLPPIPDTLTSTLSIGSKPQVKVTDVPKSYPMEILAQDSITIVALMTVLEVKEENQEPQKPELGSIIRLNN